MFLLQISAATIAPIECPIKEAFFISNAFKIKTASSAYWSHENNLLGLASALDLP